MQVIAQVPAYAPWAILVASVLPFVMAGVSKSRGFTMRDNAQTRAWQAQLTGYQQRALWAMQNAFETLPIFIGAVILAAMAAPHSKIAPIAAWAYVGLRVVDSAAYVADKASLRSLVWVASMAAIVTLFGVAIASGVLEARCVKSLQIGTRYLAYYASCSIMMRGFPAPDAAEQTRTKSRRRVMSGRAGMMLPGPR
jgi:uncharacterized MAPEG superfamily protein